MPVATFDVVQQFRGTQTIDVWAVLSHRDPMGAAREYAFAQRVLTYPAGASIAPKTDARLGSISRPSFALSDRRGQLRGVSLTFDAIDHDYTIRGWLENPNQDNVRNITLAIYIIPEDQRRSEYTPQLLFRGIVKEPEFLADRLVRFVCEDPFTTSFGELVPFFQVNKTTFPNAPTDSLGTVVTPAYGDLADEGGTDDPPEPADEAASGASYGSEFTDDRFNSPRTAGMVFNYENTECRSGLKALGGTAPANVTIGETLANGGVWTDQVGLQHYAGVAFIPDGSDEGDWDPFLPKDWTAIAPLTDAAASLDVSCDTLAGDPAGIYRHYLANKTNNNLNGYKYIDSPTPGVSFTNDNHQTLAPRSRYLVAAWKVGGALSPVSKIIGLTQIGPRLPRVVLSAPPMGATHCVLFLARPGAGAGNVGASVTLSPSDFVLSLEVDASQVNGDGHFYAEIDFDSLGGWTAISGLEAAKLGIIPGVDVGDMYVDDDSGDVSATDASGTMRRMFLFAHGPMQEVAKAALNDTLIADSRYGVDVWLPDKTGWDDIFPARTVTINGDEFTVGFLAGDALATYLAAGTEGRFALNGKGAYTGELGVDDALITSIYDQIAHVANNFTLPPALGQEPYKAGAWKAPAEFADGTVVVNTASVTAVKARAGDADMIPSGDAGAWFLREGITAQELHAQLHVSGGIRGGWQPSGQYRMVLWDPAATPTRRLTEVHDFVARSFSFKPSYTEPGLETVVDYQARYDVIAGAYELADTYDGTNRFGSKRSRDGAVLFRMRRSLAPCGDIARLMVRRFGQPLLTGPLEVAGLHALDVLPGECIAVDHSDGSGQGAKGWRARPVHVDEVAPDADGYRVALVLEDYRAVYPDWLLEELMADLSFGGHRQTSAVDGSDDGEHDWTGEIVPYNHRIVRVPWSLLNGFSATARVQIAVDGGGGRTVAAKIWNVTDDVIVGALSSTHDTADFDERTFSLPEPSPKEDKDYMLLFEGADGAVADDIRGFGLIRLTPA